MRLLIVIFFSQALSIYALEVDETLTLRFLRASSSKKQCLLTGGSKMD